MAIEIVSFPIRNGDIQTIAMLVITRGYQLLYLTWDLDEHSLGMTYRYIYTIKKDSDLSFVKGPEGSRCCISSPNMKHS